ncbi:lytic transglycosylase domain-containing protein [Paracoccus shanxieyensis]|nr:lytic transglycosylase domain-containing protein [Paracoccus shanxieyensis]
MYPLRDRIFGTVTALLLAFGLKPAMAEDAGALARALDLSARRDWVGAQAQAAQSGPIAQDLIQWQRLRAGQGSFPDYAAFALAHRDWPGMALLYRRGDATLNPDLPPGQIVAWFGDRQPDTLNGAQSLITALSKLDPEEAQAEIARFWTSHPLTAAETQVFVSAHGPQLVGLHDARLAAMLDQRQTEAAQAVLPLASPAAQALGKARIATQGGAAGVDALILALPDQDRADAGLALDRFRWRVRAKMGDLARDLMLERSTSAEALRDPEAWASLRADYSRASMRAGDWPLAERFAAGHFTPEGSDDFIELEWLAGFAALKQGATDRAVQHFSRLEARTVSPISRSRAHYWMARSYDAAGQSDQALAQYRQAAGWQTAYYGQLAAEHLGQTMQPELAHPGRGIDTLPDWRGSDLRLNPVWQAGVWLLAAGDADQAARFFLHLAETAPPEDIGRMSRLMLEVHRPWHALRLAKAAAAKGVVYPAAYFPLTGLETKPLGLPPELVMSIARRESEFNHTVASPVGALGLMQVMPDTGRAMARKLGEPFEQRRMTRDPAYNARLGAAYLQGLRDRFGPSIALVSSGYNAGPGRPARWLGDFGDLRRGADPVEWVEMIPFDETRNYVMRVTEALPIYRARIMGHPAPLVPTYDLTGGGMMPIPPQPPIRLAFSPRPPMSQRALAAMAAGGVLAEIIRPALLIEEASAAATGAAGAVVVSPAVVNPAVPSPAVVSPAAVSPGSASRADATATR